MLGIREPEHYGKEDYTALENKIKTYCDGKCEVELKQSNHEGKIVDYIQSAFFEKIDGIVINPAAYTHTSIAILDALKAVRIPAVEVHISDVGSREEFRRISYAGMACIKTVSGQGTDGYLLAIDTLIKHIEEANI